jgi:hypothetical protein
MLIDSGFRQKSDSLLGRQHFQTAYVTTDLDEATAMFAQRHGIEEFHYTRDFALPMGGFLDQASAWAGDVNIEIIQGRGNRDSIFERGLPESGFALKFHHFGYVIPDRESWDSLVQTIDREKRDIVFSGSLPEGLDWIFIDAPELGHYLEYVIPDRSWITLFESLPRY